MSNATIAGPDVTLRMDMRGLIQEVSLSGGMAGQDARGLIGRAWGDTVADVGGEKVRRMLEDARVTGISPFRQVNQRFSNGLELPIEYTAVRLGGKAGLLAIGRNLQAVAELQSRLIAAQQAMERDYWKYREVETRYRLLFQASTESVLLVGAHDLRIVEVNPAALRVLGLEQRRLESVIGRDFLDEVAPSDRDSFQAMLARARERGKGPSLTLQLGHARTPCSVRASLMRSEVGPVFMLQLSAMTDLSAVRDRRDLPGFEDLAERIPDAFVIISRDGVVRRANRAFLDLVEVGSDASVLGERLERWLGRPGADTSVLVSNVLRTGMVRLFATVVRGELGTETEVEMSAASEADAAPGFIGIIMRNVLPRIPLAAAAEDANSLRARLGPMAEQVGRTPLRKLVEETVGVIERHYIEAALEMANGNRTSAAELLGMSRQSLYAKLDRYSLDGA